MEFDNKDVQKINIQGEEFEMNMPEEDPELVVKHAASFSWAQILLLFLVFAFIGGGILLTFFYLFVAEPTKTTSTTTSRQLFVPQEDLDKMQVLEDSLRPKSRTETLDAKVVGTGDDAYYAGRVRVSFLTGVEEIDVKSFIRFQEVTPAGNVQWVPRGDDGFLDTFPISMKGNIPMTEEEYVQLVSDLRKQSYIGKVFLDDGQDSSLVNTRTYYQELLAEGKPPRQLSLTYTQDTFEKFLEEVRSVERYLTIVPTHRIEQGFGSVTQATTSKKQDEDDLSELLQGNATILFYNPEGPEQLKEFLEKEAEHITDWQYLGATSSNPERAGVVSFRQPLPYNPIEYIPQKYPFLSTDKSLLSKLGLQLDIVVPEGMEEAEVERLRSAPNVASTSKIWVNRMVEEVSVENEGPETQASESATTTASFTPETDVATTSTSE